MKVKTHQAVLLWFVCVSGCILHADERLLFSKLLLWKCAFPCVRGQECWVRKRGSDAKEREKVHRKKPWRSCKSHAELFSKGGNQFDAGNCQLQELTRCSQGDRQLWSSLLVTQGRCCRPTVSKMLGSRCWSVICANLAGLGCWPGCYWKFFLNTRLTITISWLLSLRLLAEIICHN